MLSWAYIAGFLDGEGHIGLSQQWRCGDNQFSRGRLTVTIVQTKDRGLQLLTELKAFLESHDIKSVIRLHDRNDHDPKHSVSYEIRIDGFMWVIPFLKYVLPFLHIKKLEAQDILRYATLFPSLKGKGHSHTVNGLRGWDTRRERYGLSGRSMDTGSC